MFRAYKRNSSRVRDLIVESTADLEWSFSLKFSQVTGTSAELGVGTEVHRLAALLRPFVQSGSIVEVHAVWQRLLDTGLISDEVQRHIAGAFADADRLSLALTINGRTLSARDVLVQYGDEYYGSTVPGSESVGDASPEWVRGVIDTAFHDACARYAGLVLQVLEVMLEVERTLPNPVGAPGHPGPCLWCGSTVGDFGSEEHAIPESLVGDEVVLIGSVCRQCNNELSRLDEALITFEPVAFLRTIYGPMTKKGQFPKARFRDFDIERIQPSVVRVTDKSSRAPIQPVDQPGGGVEIPMQIVGCRPADPITLARSVVKIGLSMVAFDAGAEAALDSRYDAARAFVRQGVALSTQLLIPVAGRPHPHVRVRLLPSPVGMLVLLDVFGVQFVSNLEPNSLPLPPDHAEGEVLEFWLGEGTA